MMLRLLLGRQFFRIRNSEGGARSNIEHSNIIAVEVDLCVDFLECDLIVGAGDNKRDIHVVFGARRHLNDRLHVEDVSVPTRFD